MGGAVEYSTEQAQRKQSPILANGLAILLVSRLLSAWYNIIHDCDEVYNYWEPLHYIMYGYGMQTWEYSAAFALRSWWYIVLHGMIGWPLSLVFGKVGVFYGVRAVLAVLSALAEWTLCSAVATRYHPHVAKLYLVFSVFSSGMFVSSSAFLPSSVAMVAMTLGAAGVLQRNDTLVIWSAVVGCTWGWIVAALAFIPYAIWVLVSSEHMFRSWRTLFMAAMAACVPLVACDRWYYGSWKASLINFLEYNVKGGGKSDLYGIEPATYYLRNGLNQLQTVLPLALMFPLMMGWKPRSHSMPRTTALFTVLAPAFVWLAAISYLPHKEERFLYVVYPLLLLAAAAVTVQLKDFFNAVFPAWLVRRLVAFGVLSTCVLGISRTCALTQHYGAQMSLYRMLPAGINQQARVCVGTEWYRFPSSFFLPGPEYRLQFVRSGFDGLLPRPFEETKDGTMAAPQQFNDMNRSEPDNYWDSADGCDYFVTSSTHHDDATRHMIDGAVLDQEKWKVRASVPMVDTAASPALFRALYIPFLSEKRNTWMTYILLERKKSLL
mmetsp:Transcript_13042/g.26069  ORF Transcript_13042/g.26069 Transcript_13042/m.26069 type:complete len:549 (+) Transcript_13042:210-1856(+)